MGRALDSAISHLICGKREVAQGQNIYVYLDTGEWLSWFIRNLEGENLEDGAQGDLERGICMDLNEEMKRENFCITKDFCRPPKSIYYRRQK